MPKLARIYSLLCLLIFCISGNAEAADPCANKQGYDYCMCLMYPNGVLLPPAKAFAAPLYSCFTDTTQVTIAPATTAYPRGLIPYAVYKGLKDSNLSKLLKNIVYSMLSMSVALFGIRIFFGLATEIKAETIYLVMKVAAIAYFFSSAPKLYLDMLNVMKQFMDIMVTSSAGLRAAITDQDASFWKACVKDVSGTLTNAAPANSTELWQMWDCAFNYLVGLTPDSPLSNTKTITAFMGIVGFAMLLAGTLAAGVLVLLIILYLVTGLFGLVLKFLQTVILAVLALSFMFIVGYMFVPLILFKQTYQYFHKWLNLCISYILTPVLAIAFMCLALVLVDITIFTGKSSLFEMMVKNARTKVYDEAGANSPFNVVLSNVTDKYNNVFGVDNANNAGVACDGDSLAQGGMFSSRISPSNPGSVSLQKWRATTSSVGFELKSLYLTQCTNSDPDNPSPIGCRAYNTAVGPGLADIYTDTTVATPGYAGGQNLGGNNTWLYVKQVLTASAVAALVVYILNALFPYIPKLINGLVSQGMDTSRIMDSNKIIGQDKLGTLIGKSFQYTAGKNTQIKNITDKLRQAMGNRT